METKLSFQLRWVKKKRSHCVLMLEDLHHVRVTPVACRRCDLVFICGTFPNQVVVSKLVLKQACRIIIQQFVSLPIEVDQFDAPTWALFTPLVEFTFNFFPLLFGLLSTPKAVARELVAFVRNKCLLVLNIESNCWCFSCGCCFCSCCRLVWLNVNLPTYVPWVGWKINWMNTRLD